MGSIEIGPISEEFAGTELGDRRLDGRAVKIVEAIAASPGDSFPDVTSDDGELEALYRFVNNDRVELEPLLAPHFRQTARRAAQSGRVLVIHDTTGFSFGGETRRKGLGRMKRAGEHAAQGFYAHVALVASSETGAPLGVAGIIPVFRTGDPIPYPDRKQDRNWEREFNRWGELVETSSRRLQESRCIHVMDREADAYGLFCQLTESKQDFVIRSKDDRKLDVPRGNKDQPRLLHDAIERGRYVMTREVQLTTKRSDRMARLRKAAARMTRVAELNAMVTRVHVRHPDYTEGRSRRGSPLPRAVPMNVVHVHELNAPEDQKPVEWTLLTTLPVDTEEDVQLVIDCYRRRWLIEEYFKAIKTSCAYEKRQLESAHALLNALGLFIPMAWRLLAIRNLAREKPDLSASEIISDRHVLILRARGKVALSPTPTVREVMLAIAAEGGHIKNNGDPGWQVLGRGYEKLLHMELGYVIAKSGGEI
jgi:IS4 transposase